MGTDPRTLGYQSNEEGSRISEIVMASPLTGLVPLIGLVVGGNLDM